MSGGINHKLKTPLTRQTLSIKKLYCESGYRITVLPQVSNLLTGVRLPLPALTAQNPARGCFIINAYQLTLFCYTELMAGDFYQNVYKLVKEIPPGRVATYGQIAATLDKPRSARLVGWALNVCPAAVPWQRVINHEGMISIKNRRATKELQAQLLRAEGIQINFKGGNFWVDLKKYLWQTK
jgi:methylated-DNA-protein-cysteine methyltransferase-like protein